MKKLLALAALLALLGPASTAKADSMFVDYDLSLTVAVASLALTVGVFNGVGQVQYSATGGIASGTAGTILHAPAQLIGGSIGGPFAFTVGGVANLFTGNLAGTFGGNAVGTLASAGGLTLPAAGGMTGSIHCATGNALCGLAGFVASVPQGLTFGFSAVLSAPSVAPGSNLPAAFTFNPLSFGTFAGFPVTAVLQVSEISRHYSSENVPEPQTALLLSLGLVGVLVAGRSAAQRLRN